MKLSEWARQRGLSYRTAWRLFRDGKLPVPSEQLQTGTILVSESVDRPRAKELAVYARVSSQDQKKDLDSQVARLCQFATSRKLPISRVVTEIASGMNGNRGKLKALLSDPAVECILVEHRDRLARWGFEYLEAALKSTGRSILVLDEKELKDDKNELVRDMIEVLTSFCARLYGRRSAENRAQKALKFLETENGNHLKGKN